MREIEELKLCTWNLGLGAAITWCSKKELKREAVDKLMKQAADIIVLTEYAVCKGCDYLHEQAMDNGYIWKEYNITGSNGIFILIKRDLVKDAEKEAKKLWDNKGFALNPNINMLEWTIKLKNGKKLCILGLRMTVELDGNLEDQYNKLGEDLKDVLIKRVKELKAANDIVIVAGDFNNARYLDSYEDYAQENYNWQIIKNAFEGIGFNMLDLDKNDKHVITKIDNGPDSPIDHIFARGLEKADSEAVHTEAVSGFDHKILAVNAKLSAE